MDENYALKYQELLLDLKTTVEGLLSTQVANVWSIYGGLNRLHTCLDKIFKHGCINSNYLSFIQGLEWLQPESSKSYVTIDCEYKPHLPGHLKNDKAAIWLYRSLENHSLSQKMLWLLSDKSHLVSCYHNFAFLCQNSYSEATLICLRAVERNQPSLMSEINPCLFVMKNKSTVKVHRRCFSFPDSQLKKIYEEQKMSRKSQTVTDFKSLPETKISQKMQGKLKLWQSTPSLVDSLNKNTNSNKILSKTVPSTPVHDKKLPDVNKSKDLVTNSKKTGAVPKKLPVKHVLINNCDIIEHTPPLSSSQSSGAQVNEDLAHSSRSRQMAHSPRSVVEEYGFLPLSGEKDPNRYPKKTFIEDGGMSVQPMTTGYFPKPIKGQSLTSFLASGQFSRANAELDRENAHFSISEAIISAMEQIRCNRNLKLADEQLDESDPEIMDLKQRIRLRRRQKLAERHRKVWTHTILSDGKTDTTTSVSPCSTTPDSLSDCHSSDDIEDLEIDQASNLTDQSRGLSMSMASLYSDADLVKRPRDPPDGASDILSAESVALSLISKFSEKQLPKASDLEWLVSEEDAPQALLPLPKSWPVSPDDSEEPSTPLRGTHEWAPPRAQLILTMHCPPSRKVLMAKQNYRCAGCSMRVAPQYASKFRYCDYLGRYFCTGCHANQLAIIPARVLQKWNFTRYPVSTFSYRLLEQMYTDPLFRVFELNKNIVKMSKNLQFCRKYRQGIYYLKDFIFTCRFGETIKEYLERDMPSYALTDPEVYSMKDLVEVRNGEMKSKLKYLVEMCCRHTSECKLCLARGFICEICNDDQIIFPWQMRHVSRCIKCGACYHSKCWNADEDPCKKCSRIAKRKESIEIDCK